MLGAIRSRIRAFESLIDSFNYSLSGFRGSSEVHWWIFKYRLWHGRYPNNQEIAEAKRDGSI